MVYTTREYTQLQKAGLAVSLVAWGILLLRPAQAASWCCGGDCLTPVQTVLAWDPPFSLVVRMVMASYAPGSVRPSASAALVIVEAMDDDADAHSAVVSHQDQ